MVNKATHVRSCDMHYLSHAFHFEKYSTAAGKWCLDGDARSAKMKDQAINKLEDDKAAWMNRAIEEEKIIAEQQCGIKVLDEKVKEREARLEKREVKQIEEMRKIEVRHGEEMKKNDELAAVKHMEEMKKMELRHSEELKKNEEIREMEEKLKRKREECEELRKRLSSSSSHLRQLEDKERRKAQEKQRQYLKRKRREAEDREVRRKVRIEEIERKRMQEELYRHKQ